MRIKKGIYQTVKTVDSATKQVIATATAGSGITLSQVKADSDIADALSKKHSSGSDNQDLSNLVVKETGKSLVSDTLIGYIHQSGSDNQDLSSYVQTSDSRLSDSRNAADVYTWAKAATKPTYTYTEVGAEVSGAVSTHESSYTHANIATAYNHSQAAHAPSNAQANADITKGEIEAKLTGTISTHSHSGGADPFVAKLTVSGDKATGANTTPVTLGISFNYAANKKYIVDIYAIVSPTAATTGCGFLIDTSSAVTYVGTFTVHQLANTGTVSGGSSIGDLGATLQGVSSGHPSTGSNFVYGGGLLITTSNTGTATFYFRSETTAVTTCKDGSFIRVMEV